MSVGDGIAYIGVPLLIFILSGIATGITLLVKGSAYMARSAAAQESTAATNSEISKTLKAYIGTNDIKVNDLDRRLYAVERQDGADRRGPT